MEWFQSGSWEGVKTRINSFISCGFIWVVELWSCMGLFFQILHLFVGSTWDFMRQSLASSYPVVGADGFIVCGGEVRYLVVSPSCGDVQPDGWQAKDPRYVLSEKDFPYLSHPILGMGFFDHQSYSIREGFGFLGIRGSWGTWSHSTFISFFDWWLLQVLGAEDSWGWSMFFVAFCFECF